MTTEYTKNSHNSIIRKKKAIKIGKMYEHFTHTQRDTNSQKTHEMMLIALTAEIKGPATPNVNEGVE